MKEIKWGFIGCGEVVEKKSGPAFNLVPGSRVLAVMSRTQERAQSYAIRHNIKRWYTDASELVNDPEVNAVYIATPPSSHPSYAIMSMMAGKPVYIEKPLASSYDDCARINRVSRETGVPCFVAYYRRYLPYFIKVKEIIENQTIGEIQNVQIRYSTPPRKEDLNPSCLPWRVKPEIAGGGYFYDMAAHQLDFIQELFGVITHARGYSSNRGHLYDAEDTISACFQFENGLPGSGSWCFVGHESHIEDRIEVLGTQGTLCFSVFSYSPIHLHTSEGVMTFDVPNPEYVQLPMIKVIVETLQGINQCSCTSLSATPVNWVMDRMLKKI